MTLIEGLIENTGSFSKTAKPVADKALADCVLPRNSHIIGSLLGRAATPVNWCVTLMYFDALRSVFGRLINAPPL